MHNLKKFIFFINRIKNLCYRQYYKFVSAKVKFTKIYYTNAWGGKNSVSGRGSDSDQTAMISKEIPILIKKLKAKTLLDASCGDFLWMQYVIRNTNVQYIGADIVKELIENNQKKYSRENIEFQKLDIIKDTIPYADIILCRDCLVHFSFKDISSVLKNFKQSQSKYLLTTTFTNHTNNKNITTGYWRPINLQFPPLNFPEPLTTINEECTECDSEYSDKSLGLWKLKDINVRN